jgi:hypothetical protein
MARIRLEDLGPAAAWLSAPALARVDAPSFGEVRVGEKDQRRMTARTVSGAVGRVTGMARRAARVLDRCAAARAPAADAITFTHADPGNGGATCSRA